MDQNERHYALFFGRERIAVGWSAIDLTGGEAEAVVSRVVGRYYAHTDVDPRSEG